MKITGLCRYCKNRSWWCGDNHYCDSGNNFAPFAPISGLKYSREEIIDKWYVEVERRNHVK